jgi:1-acyl-sn-glycerol-3-phosphate acyltransferase
MGGIPVDKKKPGAGLTDVAIENMKKINGSLIAMSPEGTRAKTEKMKSGFLRIAKAVEGSNIFWEPLISVIKEFFR